MVEYYQPDRPAQLSIDEQTQLTSAVTQVECIRDPAQRQLVVSAMQRRVGQQFNPARHNDTRSDVYSIVDACLTTGSLPLLVKVIKMVGGMTDSWSALNQLVASLLDRDVVLETEFAAIQEHLKALTRQGLGEVLASPLLMQRVELASLQPPYAAEALRQFELAAGEPGGDLRLLTFLELVGHRLHGSGSVAIHRTIDEVARRHGLGSQINELCRTFYLEGESRTGHESPERGPATVAPTQRKPGSSGGLVRLPIRSQSTAILLGVAAVNDPLLPEHPAIDNNITDLTKVLSSEEFGGFDRHRVVSFDLRDYEHDIQEIVRIANEATDTLLIYYAGHGHTEPNGELYLALPTTKNGIWPWTALPYELIRQLVTGLVATNVVILLDCCFSGAALNGLSGAVIPSSVLDVAGTYVMTATSATRQAHVPQGARNSAFTGALLEVLRLGLDTTEEFIPMGKLYQPVKQRLVSQGLPPPQQRGTNTIGELALVRNPAWAPFVANSSR